jgi:hypothetical protein
MADVEVSKSTRDCIQPFILKEGRIGQLEAGDFPRRGSSKLRTAISNGQSIKVAPARHH